MALAQQLPASRYRNLVALPATGWLYDRLLSLGFSPFLVGGRKGFDFAYLRELVRIIREYRVDIVQSHLFGSNLYCCLAGMLARVPVVCTFHGGVDVGQRSIGRWIKLRIIGRLAARVVSVSHALEVELLRLGGLTPRKCTVIHNGIDPVRYASRRDNTLRRQLGLVDGDVLIGAVGNIRPAKDYVTLLHAAARLVSLSPRYRIAIAGEGRNALSEKLLALRQKLGLENVVHFVGFQADVAGYLNNLDLFVLSSSSEGFSISTIEAMACLLPVVATRSGGPEEIIDHGVNGMLVLVGDSVQFAEHLHSLVCDSVRAGELAIAARATILNRYGQARMLSLYEAIYDEL